jgi:hypothetical protein
MREKEFRRVSGTNCSTRSPAFWKLLALFAVALAACDGGSAGGDKHRKDFGLAEYLCALSKTACHSKLHQRVYLAPSDATYEINLGGQEAGRADGVYRSCPVDG